MKQIIKIKHIIAILLMFLISGTAYAEIQEEWPFGMRNPLPDDPTYVRFDFEKNSTYFDSYQGIVNFVNLNENKWAAIPIGARGYHIYPMDFFYKYDNETRVQVDYIYVVNGERGAQPVFWRCTNVKCDWWPGNEARIEFPSGASDVSFLSSNGANLVMRAYDKTGKYIGSSDIAYPNTDRIPPNPSNFTRVSITTKTPSIYAVEIIAGINNFWLIDDIVIGGLTFPDKPTDYNYAAERMEELIGTQYLKHGAGYDLYLGKYYTADEIKNIPLPYIDFDIKPYEVDWNIGIDSPGAILWAFNQESNVVKWYDLNDQMKHDFTEHVNYEDIQSGNVGFIDYPEYNEETGLYGPGDGLVDEAFMIINSKEDTTGDMVDCIRIIPEAGVHYSTTKFINAHYGTGPGTVDYRSLKDSPKGGHKPYKTLPTNKV